MKPLALKAIPAKDLAAVFDLGYRSSQCTKPSEIKDLFRHFLLIFPVKRVVCGIGVPNGTPEEASRALPSFKMSKWVHLNWPEDTIEAFFSKEYFSVDDDFYRRAKAHAPHLSVSIVDAGVEQNRRTNGHRNSHSGIVLGFASSKDARCSKKLLEAILPFLHAGLVRAFSDPKTKLINSNGNRLISEREKEVLKWIYEGKTNWEISSILGVSERTIKFHVQNLMTKFNATNRYHLVAKSVSPSIGKIGPIEQN